METKLYGVLVRVFAPGETTPYSVRMESTVYTRQEARDAIDKEMRAIEQHRLDNPHSPFVEDSVQLTLMELVDQTTI